MGTIGMLLMLVALCVSIGTAAVSIPQFNGVISCYNERKTQNEELAFKSKSQVYAPDAKTVCELKQEILFSLDDCLMFAYSKNSVLPNQFKRYVEEVALNLRPGMSSSTKLKIEHDEQCYLYPRTTFIVNE